jgi:hypothetical protein
VVGGGRQQVVVEAAGSPVCWFSMGKGRLRIRRAGKIQPLASKFISGSLMRTTSQRNETPYVTKTKVLSV